MEKKMEWYKEKVERKNTISENSSTMLDVIRFLSAQLVLIGHGLTLCQLTFLQQPVYFPYIQNIGVVFLLLLSGYLMGYKIKTIYHSEDLSAENGNGVYKEFILKKVGRIYAGLLPAMIFVWVIDSVAIAQAPDAYYFYPNFTFSNFLASLTMVQRMPAFGNILFFGSAPQIWTLSIEWWMFVLCGYLAFCVIPFCHTGRLRIKHLILLLLMGYPVVQYLYFGKVMVTPIIWIIGMIVYYLQDKLVWRINRISHRLLVLTNLTILIQIGIWKKDAYCTEFIFCSAVLFFIITTPPEKVRISDRVSKIFRSAASTAYSLYLIHYSIFEYFVRVYPEMDPAKKFWYMILISEAAAIAFSSAFENKGKVLYKRLLSAMNSKKTTVGIGMLLGVLFLYSIAVNSPVWIQKMSVGFKGMGIKESPYVIETVEDFSRFRDLVNSGESFAGKYFYQSNDLDLSGIENWEPIGIYGSGKYFSGYYDGGGRAIRNLRCEAGNEIVGLFGMLCGEVRNLGIESGIIRGGCVGSIASHGSNHAKIINCYNKADIYGTIRAGGIADNFAGDILFCINIGNVSCENPDNAFGLVSYDCEALIYSYATKDPVVATRFSGNILEAESIQPYDLNEAFLQERHSSIMNWLNRSEETEKIMRISDHDGTMRMEQSLFGTTANIMKFFSLIVVGLFVPFLYFYRNRYKI